MPPRKEDCHAARWCIWMIDDYFECMEDVAVYRMMVVVVVVVV
jgi:hypothetical protein